MLEVNGIKGSQSTDRHIKLSHFMSYGGCQLANSRNAHAAYDIMLLLSKDSRCPLLIYNISLFYSTMTLISPVMALRLYILHVKLNKCLCHPVGSRALNS